MKDKRIKEILDLEEFPTVSVILGKSSVPTISSADSSNIDKSLSCARCLASGIKDSSDISL